VAKQIDVMYEVCQKPAHGMTQVICATDASVPTTSQWQAAAVAACWVGGHQILSVKAQAGRATSELFAIRLAISKATIHWMGEHQHSHSLPPSG